MDKKVSYLLVGNTRLHWAQKINQKYNFSHTLKEESIPDEIIIDNLIWASVANYPIKQFKKENELQIKDLNLKNLPKNFGIDRAFGCVAALNIINNPLNKNLLIADFGTILSITKVDHQGYFIGGQLIPGFLTQLKSMEQNTKNLKCPDNFDIPEENFQISTKKAMLKGVYNSLIGVIKLCFNSQKDILIICGGDSEVIGKKMILDIEEMIINPNLVMRGMILTKENLN